MLSVFVLCVCLRRSRAASTRGATGWRKSVCLRTLAISHIRWVFVCLVASVGVPVFAVLDALTQCGSLIQRRIPTATSTSRQDAILNGWRRKKRTVREECRFIYLSFYYWHVSFKLAGWSYTGRQCYKVHIITNYMSHNCPALTGSYRAICTRPRSPQIEPHQEAQGTSAGKPRCVCGEVAPNHLLFGSVTGVWWNKSRFMTP